MKKWKIDRIISIATLVASLIAIILVLKKPAPVSTSQPPAAIAANAQSFDQKMAQLEQAVQQSHTQTPTPDAQPAQNIKTQVRINSDEIGAVLAQSLGTAS